MIKVGDRTKKIRLQKGFTQEQLARLIGRPTSYVTRFELNEFQNPKIDTLKRFSKALGISVMDFLNEDKNSF